MALNSNNVCESCRGRVTNATGRRKTIEQLTEIHNKTCAGKGKRVKEDGDTPD